MFGRTGLGGAFSRTNDRVALDYDSGHFAWFAKTEINRMEELVSLD